MNIAKSILGQLREASPLFRGEAVSVVYSAIRTGCQDLLEMDGKIVPLLAPGIVKPFQASLVPWAGKERAAFLQMNPDNPLVGYLLEQPSDPDGLFASSTDPFEGLVIRAADLMPFAVAMESLRHLILNNAGHLFSRMEVSGCPGLFLPMLNDTLLPVVPPGYVRL